jgi:hypothetical protein
VESARCKLRESRRWPGALNIRQPRPSDLSTLQALAAATGTPWPSRVELLLVVADDDDAPIAAFWAEQILGAGLCIGQMPPLEAIHALRLLEAEAIPALRARGWRSIHAFVGPELEKAFGRRIIRTFGWVRCWTAFYKRL